MRRCLAPAAQRSQQRPEPDLRMKLSLQVIPTALAFAAVSLAAAEPSAPSAATGNPSVPYMPKQSDRPQPLAGDEPGFESIFDGRTLNGWKGDPKYWRVENGALVGEITPQTVVKSN